jgi:clan AA aspartic protease
MGMTMVKMTVRKDRSAEGSFEREFLVDSGAAYTVVAGEVLRRLGVEPTGTQDFHLADGTKITRRTGDAYFEFGDKQGDSKVIFGEGGDSELLGAITLESFGLALDPLKRELRPMRLLLM